ASSGAAEFARTAAVSGADAPSLANAAAHSVAVRSAAVFAQNGALLAITNHEDAQLALTAFHAAGEAGVWAGAPQIGDLPTAPVLVRRVGDEVIVSILDSARLMPELSDKARVLVAAPEGPILYASPALARAGVRAEDQLHGATRGAHTGETFI